MEECAVGVHSVQYSLLQWALMEVHVGAVRRPRAFEGTGGAAERSAQTESNTYLNSTCPQRMLQQS